MGTFECRTDAEGNRVYITLSGFFRGCAAMAGPAAKRHPSVCFEQHP